MSKDHEAGQESKGGNDGTAVKREAWGTRITKEKAAYGQRRPIVARLAGAKSHG